MPSKVAKDRVEWRGWHGMQEVSQERRSPCLADSTFLGCLLLRLRLNVLRTALIDTQVDRFDAVAAPEWRPRWVVVHVHVHVDVQSLTGAHWRACGGILGR